MGIDCYNQTAQDLNGNDSGQGFDIILVVRITDAATRRLGGQGQRVDDGGNHVAGDIAQVAWADNR